jgi:hypothetical protein
MNSQFCCFFLLATSSLLPIIVVLQPYRTKSLHPDPGGPSGPTSRQSVHRETPALHTRQQYALECFAYWKTWTPRILPCMNPSIGTNIPVRWTTCRYLRAHKARQFCGSWAGRLTSLSTSHNMLPLRTECTLSMTSPLPQNIRLRPNGRVGVIVKEGATVRISASHITSCNQPPECCDLGLPGAPSIDFYCALSTD